MLDNLRVETETQLSDEEKQRSKGSLRRAIYNPEKTRAMVWSREGLLAPSPKWLNGPRWDHITQERNRVWSKMEMLLEGSIWCNQTHSSHVQVVTDADMGSGARGPAEFNADAMVCKSPHPEMTLAIKAADCAFGTMRCFVSGVMAVFHAGTRGQQNGIIPKTVGVMCELGAVSENIEVCVGPMISQQNYGHARYGPMVQFYAERALAQKHNGQWFVDQEGMVRRQLYTAGIDPDNLFLDGRCTYEDPSLCSHVGTEREHPHLDADVAGFQRGNNVMVIGGRCTR